MTEILEGGGSNTRSYSALGNILHSKSALESSEETTLEAAAAALSEVALAVGETRHLLPSHAVIGSRKPYTDCRRIQCNVLYLDQPELFVEGEDFRYLINDDGRLLPIEHVRASREHSHYRVTLLGSKTTIPVKSTAMAFVSTESDLAGMTLVQVRNRG